MDNANLAKLRLTTGKLVPPFSQDVTEYSVTVSSGVSEVKLSVQTSDSGASCVVKGGGVNEDKTVKLVEGQTSRVDLIVTAEDGKTIKSYILTIRRLSADDAILSHLEINEGTLVPLFSPFVQAYECYLPWSVCSVLVRATPEDQAMVVTMADDTALRAIDLSSGCTLVQIKIRSTSGQNSKIYAIKVVKQPLPYVMEAASRETVTCFVCGGLPYRHCRISSRTQVYCYPCLEGITRTNKRDIVTGTILEGEWLAEDYSMDSQLSRTLAVCKTPRGTVEDAVGSLGEKLLKQRANHDGTDVPSQNCDDCSRKIPNELISVHKDLLCTAKYPLTLTKKEFKSLPWEVRMADCTLGNNVQVTLKLATTFEEQYITALSKGESKCHELLWQAASCYATAAKINPSDVKSHMGLALIMEEIFYADDLYGFKKQDETEEENDAIMSSNEEEFIAICKLHGVGPTDHIAEQLKAVEAEYHSLKLAGQMLKAEHVQQLHAWKSKKASQANHGLLGINEIESSLIKAKKKFLDCTCIDPSDATASYNFGRLCLLLGDAESAIAYLKAATALKPFQTPACLCLGLALKSQAPNHAAVLLCHGLCEYLLEREKDSLNTTEELVKELHSKAFFQPSNILIIESFIALAELGGRKFLSDEVCLLYAARCLADAKITYRGSIYKKFQLLSLRARSNLLHSFVKRKDKLGWKHYTEVRCLLINCGLPITDDLRALQMEVCQLGVILQPNSSEALCCLGNVQMSHYEATGEEKSLKGAELSFRASISQEGNAIMADVVPEQLLNQEWWMLQRDAESINTYHQTNGTASVLLKQEQFASKKDLNSMGSTNRQAGVTARHAQPTASKQKQPGTQTMNNKATPKTQQSVQSKVINKPSARQVATQSKILVKTPAKNTTTEPKPSSNSFTGKTSTLKTSTSKAAGTCRQQLSTQHNNQASNKQRQPNIIREDSKTKGEIVMEDLCKSSHTVEITSSTETNIKRTEVETNKKSYLPRLGMARVLAKSSKDIPTAVGFYKEVISMAPGLHEAYIELGEILTKTEPLIALDIYSTFPFSSPPSFDDAFIHGEIVRILMTAEKYDDSRLCSSLISLGKAMGIAVLEKHVAILESKFKTAMLKQVYAGVHGKSMNDPDLQQFFKMKCWT